MDSREISIKNKRLHTREAGERQAVEREATQGTLYLVQEVKLLSYGGGSWKRVRKIVHGAPIFLAYVISRKIGKQA